MELLPLLKKIPNIYSAKISLKKTLLVDCYQQGLLALSRCDLCGLPCQHYLQLCDVCYDDLPLFKQSVVQGDLLNWPAVYQHLPHIGFEQLICLAPHGYPFDHWLGQYKYSKRFELAELFSHLLGDLLASLLQKEQLSKPELMLAVPLHISRWQGRGYNQAHILAQKLQKKLSSQYTIEYHPQLLARNKKITAQVGKSGKQRRENLAGAFSLTNEQPLPEHVMLIDDVVTTGATASEICYLLKQQGVKKVTLVTLTIALLK